MAESVAQTLREIKQLPLLTVQPRFDAEQSVADLLHPDCFVADTDVTLRQVLSGSDRGVSLLGKRLASMVTSDAVLPLSLKYFDETDRIRIIHRGDEQGARDIDLLDNGRPPFFDELNFDFATVEMAVLPSIDLRLDVLTANEDNAAIVIPLDDAAAIKVMGSLRTSVMVNPFTAAIIPPQSAISMRGARMMLIRPKLI